MDYRNNVELLKTSCKIRIQKRQEITMQEILVHTRGNSLLEINCAIVAIGQCLRESCPMLTKIAQFISNSELTLVCT